MANTLAPAAPSRADHTHAAHSLIARRRDASLAAVQAYIRQPSFSDTGEGMAACAAYTRDLLAAIAPDATVVATAGYPVVLGSARSKKPDAPTLVVYGLYDVTPTLAKEWTVNPLAASIVDAPAIGLPPELGKLLVGRGAHNHKGPVLSSIMAVRALLDVAGDVPANLIYVIEGEEEIGSPSLAGFLEQHRDQLEAAQGVWLPCMQQGSAGGMTLFRSYKGLLQAEVAWRSGPHGGTRDGRHLWSGHAAWIDAPLMQLVRGLASLYDNGQRPTIDGLAERLRPPATPDGDAVRRLEAAFRANPAWQEDMLAVLHVGRLLGGSDLADHLAHYMLGATLNIQGIVGGYDGPTFYNHMPGSARAKLDLRFPPGVSHDEVAALIRAHLDRRGHAALALEAARGYPGAHPLPENDDTLTQAALRTAARYGVSVDVWPIGNNCSPGSLLTALGKPIPFSFAGLGHGDRPHAPDEYITVGSVEQLMHWTVDYLYDWAATLAART